MKDRKPKLIKGMSADCRAMLADMAEAARETQADLVEKALKVYRVPALVVWSNLLEQYSEPTRGDLARIRSVPPEMREIFKAACEELGITQGKGFYLAGLMLREYGQNRARAESGELGPHYEFKSKKLYTPLKPDPKDLAYKKTVDQVRRDIDAGKIY